MKKKKPNHKPKTVNPRKIRKPAFKEEEDRHSMQHSSSVKVGNISRISGKLNLAGGDINIKGIQSAVTEDLQNSKALDEGFLSC